MKIHHHTITVATKGRGFHDVTSEVGEVVAQSGVRSGLCSVFVRHTSASLVIQENADPKVLRDLARWLDRVAPEDASAYEHDDEGPDDMPSHLRSSLTGTSESIPIVDGRLQLGTWQAVYLAEHRRAPHRRLVLVTVLGV